MGGGGCVNCIGGAWGGGGGGGGGCGWLACWVKENGSQVENSGDPCDKHVHVLVCHAGPTAAWLGGSNLLTAMIQQYCDNDIT